jgi:hypothetical protein
MGSFGRMNRAASAPAATRARSRSSWLARSPSANCAFVASQRPDGAGGRAVGGSGPRVVSADDPTELFRSTSVGVVGASDREAHATINPLVRRAAITPVRRSTGPRVEQQAGSHRRSSNETPMSRYQISLKTFVGSSRRPVATRQRRHAPRTPTKSTGDAQS